MPELVWYAAYGSNLLWDRFRTYLEGGPVPHRPTPTIQAGARDPSPPRGDGRWTFEHELFFAGSSPGWGGGGVAFLHPEPPRPEPPRPGPLQPGSPPPAHQDAAATLGRRWLVTAEQFEDVFRQENGITVPGSDAHPGSGPGHRIDAGDGPLFDLDTVEPGGFIDAGPRWYGRVLHLGHGPDGNPVATFTGPDPYRHQRAPAPIAYLRTVGLGLLETWDLGPAEVAARLVACEGNRGAVDVDEVTADLEQWSAR
ncbi:MAG: hypothetical protein AAGD35_14625 [Actinomycetota bacterium]